MQRGFIHRFKELYTAFINTEDHFIVIGIKQGRNGIIEVIDIKEGLMTQFHQYPSLYPFNPPRSTLLLSCSLYGRAGTTHG